jgi:hypothetical protein
MSDDLDAQPASAAAANNHVINLMMDSPAAAEPKATTRNAIATRARHFSPTAESGGANRSERLRSQRSVRVAGLAPHQANTRIARVATAAIEADQCCRRNKMGQQGEW